jgi:hypothetical protein
MNGLADWKGCHKTHRMAQAKEKPVSLERVDRRAVLDGKAVEALHP